MSSQKTVILDSDEKATTSSPVKACCKKAVKFLFSHVGLVLMVVLYDVAGAFLFELLERHEEVRLCEEGKGYDKGNMTKYRQDILNYIQFNVSRDEGDHGDNETVANTQIETMLTRFRYNVLQTSSETRFIGQVNCDAEAKWDFNGGLLFCVAVFATIGYGNITPQTWEGQIVCICYAIIGIPLFLMCLANIGGALGDLFRFMYSRVCCRLCNNRDKKKKDKVVQIKHNQHAWSTDASGKPGSPRGDAAIIDDDSDNEGDEEEEEEEVTVPLTITMMIIGGYIVAGAFLFGYFEGWQPIESAYFCFITLSTVGFGDYVPGQNAADKNKNVKLIIGAVYVIFGMATIGMCFELMQKEIIAKFTWIGRMAGIIQKPQEMDGNEEDSDDEHDEDSDDESDNDVKKNAPMKNTYPPMVQGSQSTLQRRSDSDIPPSYQDPASRPSSAKKGPPSTETSLRQQSPQGSAVYRPGNPPTYHSSPNDGVEDIMETDA